MKKSYLLTVLGIIVASLTFAQSEETRNLSSFSKISAQEGIDVYLKEGSKEEARIVAKSVDADEVLTDVSGGRLKIHLEGNNHDNVNVEVYVTYKSLNGLDASSAASISCDDLITSSGDFDVEVSSAGRIQARIKSDEISIDASSAGDAELEVDVDEIEADVSSAGDVEISGSARIQDVEVGSSGDYDADEVVSEEVDVDASSGGSIRVNVTNKIKGSANSAGKIRYKGSPKYVDVSANSGGSVRKS